jgi:hypothetical protein
MRSFNRTRNGRAAWLALLTHFEGDAQKDRAKDAAYTAIANAKYYGEKKRFSFETYVTIHQEAYEDLEQYGEPVSEDKRVRDLLQGIKDPAAKAAKETVLATPHLRNNFTNAVTHLATSLQLNLSLQDNRNVSGVASGRGQGGRTNYRGGHGGYTQLQDQTEYKDRNIFSLHRSSDFIYENDMSQISSAFDNHFLHTYMI